MWIFIIIVVSTWIVVGLYYGRIERLCNVLKEPRDIYKQLLEETKRRLDKQDRKILEQQVKMDVIEIRMQRDSWRREGGELIGNDEVNRLADHTSRQITASQTSQSPTPPRTYDITVRDILKFLEKGPKTPKQIQLHIGKSREHTARLMKKLFERGIVRREETKKPFVYSLKHNA